MNKILFLLGMWLSIALISCSKKDDNNRLQQSYGIDANFAISVPASFSVEKGKAVMVSVIVSEGANGTAQENVSLSVSGLPGGISYVVTPAAGMPAYTAQITFYTTNAVATGIYPIKIIGSTPSGATKVVSVELRVTEIQDCADQRQGTYSVVDACNTGTYSYTANVTTVQNMPNTVTISNFGDLPGNVTVEATLDCNNGQVYIATQQIQAYIISGSGNFSGNQMVINYNISQGALNDYCTMTMTK